MVRDKAQVLACTLQKFLKGSSTFEPPHKKGEPYFSTSEIEAKNVNVYDSSTDNHTIGKPTPRGFDGFAE